MSGWLPRFRVGGWMGCAVDGEHEGVCVTVEWGRYLLEVVVATRGKSR